MKDANPEELLAIKKKKTMEEVKYILFICGKISMI